MNDRTNILIFMADQLRREPLDRGSLCQTPNYEAVAREGIQFERAYTPNPVCSPARASLMTGLLPHNHGVLWVTHTMEQDQCRLREENRHWAEALKDKGFTTGYFGKWHITHDDDPSRFGWEVNGSDSTDRYRSMVKNDREFLIESTMLQNEGYNDTYFSGITSLRPEERSMGVATTLALDFLENQDGSSPWCCMVSVPEPHDPFICGEVAYENYRDMDIPVGKNWSDDMVDKPAIYRRSASVNNQLTEEDWKEAVRRYYASVSEVDSQLGRLLEYLDQSGQRENTLIILLSDHGDFLGEHGLYCKNIGSFEGAFNIPLIISGPGLAEGETTTARVGLQDVLGTFKDYFSLDINAPVDSRSFLPVLTDPHRFENEYTEGFSENNGGRYHFTQRVFYRDNWKYVMNGFDYDELYNLKEDPEELINLANLEEHREKLKEMAAGAWHWIRRTGDNTLLKTGYSPFRFITNGPIC